MRNAIVSNSFGFFIGVSLTALLTTTVACSETRELPGRPPNLEQRNKELERVSKLVESLRTSELDTAAKALKDPDSRVQLAALKRIAEVAAANRSETASIEGDIAENSKSDAGKSDSVDLPNAAIPLPLNQQLVDQLLHILKDTNNAPEVRCEAAIALGETGLEQIEVPLIEAMLDADRSVRLWAWKGIKRAGPQAIRTVISSLGEETPYFKRFYLDELGNEQSHQNTISARLSSLDAKHFPDLLWGFESEDRGVRLNVARSFGGMKKRARSLVPRLIELLSTDKDHWVKIYTSRALRDIGKLNDDVESILKTTMKDKNKKVSEAAKQALDAMKKKKKEKEKKEKEKKEKKEKEKKEKEKKEKKAEHDSNKKK